MTAAKARSATSVTRPTKRTRAEETLVLQRRIADIFLTVPDDEMFDEVLSVILEVMESPLGVFGYLDEAGSLVVPTMTRQVWDQCQVPGKTIVFPRDTWGDSSWPRAVRERKPNYSNDISTKTPQGHVAVTRHICVPILFRGEVVGLFQVANKRANYDEADVRRLETISGYVAPILNARIQRKRVEEALRASEARYRSYVDVTGQIAWVTSAAGEIVEDVPSLRRFSGQTYEEAKGSGWAKTIHPDDLERTLRVWNDAVATRGNYEIEYRMRRHDGVYRHLLARGFPVFGEDGSIREWVGTCIDITGRKRSETEFRTLIQTSLDGFWINDFGGRILDTNEAFSRMLGYSREELLHMSIQDIEASESPDKTAAHIRQIIEAGGDRFETRHQCKDGTVRDVEINVQYLADLGERFFVFARDITEPKRAEETLRESERRLRELTESLPQLIWTCRADGPCDYLSPQWVAYTGIPEEEQLGFGWLEQLHPEDRAPTAVRWDAAVGAGAAFDIEFRIRRSDGAYRWFKTRALPLRDREGRVVKWLGTNSDIDEQKRAEAQVRRSLVDLQRSNQDLEQFAYVASHDLQEPLRMVASYTQLLAEKYQGQLDDKAKKYIDYAVDGAVRMQRLINDLLTYSRIGTKGKPSEATDSHAVLGEALRNLRTAIEESRALVTNDDLPLVRADALQLVQVFQNLIANAIKFRRADSPRVHVSVRNVGHEWEFSVKDNGIGIDAQYADRVFVLFQRLNTRQEYPGTGIGLALCKRIMERHGGRIWVESEPGQGSTFHFTVPE